MGAQNPLPRGISRRNGLYRVRVTYLGKRYQVGQFHTLGDAKVALTLARSRIVRGTFQSVPKQRRLREESERRDAAEAVTVAGWSQSWLQDLEVAGRSPGTIVAYKSTLRVHIIPALGDLQLKAVTTDAIEAMLIGKTDATGYNVTRTLSSMFKAAIKAGIGGLEASPVVQAGRYGKQRRSDADDFATVAEIRDIAAGMPERLQMAALLAFWCGLRLGEVLGLQRCDLDMNPNNPQLHVRRQWLMKASPPRYAAPKAGSARTEALPKSVLPALASHLADNVSADLSAPLFCSIRDNMKPISQSAFDKAWRTARESVRPGFRFHALRHVHLTMYAQAGATDHETMRRGGHTSMEVAQRYQAATAARDRMLIDQMDHMVNGQVN